MQAMLDIVARHKAGEGLGVFSVCSAHPLVIEATFIHAARAQAAFALIEATSNQVNQEGGYTGMRPADFRRFVFSIADRVGLPRERVVLGGDHLGPNVWQALPAEQAMARSEILIAEYVATGFRKIHLDCSMSCADDPDSLSDATIAERTARLCAVAERAFACSPGEPPVYVIGTEVPVPGGAAETLGELCVTTPSAVATTLQAHRAAFDAHGLQDAWRRVVAAVVQPGVEFDHDRVVDYDPDKAQVLSSFIEGQPGIVFEAHSTDYQSRAALAALVRDHFAILKVGPAVTFALREALWALSAIEIEWLGRAAASNFKSVAMDAVRCEPKHWRKYYRSRGCRLDHDLQYSLSDRIRYYWPMPQIERAKDAMFANLSQDPPSLSLLSQYLPRGYAAIRSGRIGNTPRDLVIEHVCGVLEDYQAACSPQRSAHVEARI